MGRKKLFTEEEAKQRAKANWYQNQKPKMIEEHNRLAAIRIGDEDNILKTKKERKQFKEFVREKNTKRFDEILNSEEIWERVNSSSDEWLEKEARKKRKKRLGGGKYINEKDIDRAMNIIYGGMKGEIIEEPKEEEYQNPYETETDE